LVDENFQPRLADFGLSLVGESSASGMTTSKSNAGTTRWKSPERMEADDYSRRASSGDVWAFGCLFIAVYIIFDGTVVKLC
jgi:serine/threonine protein kinase